MRDLVVLFLHLLATVARLAGPGGARSVVAESVLVTQQLLILNRSRKRSPHPNTPGSSPIGNGGRLRQFILPSRDGEDEDARVSRTIQQGRKLAAPANSRRLPPQHRETPVKIQVVLKQSLNTPTSTPSIGLKGRRHQA